MNEKHYILPPISKTPTNRDGSNNQTLTILTPAGSNPKRNQSKIPIFYSSATTKTVQEYMILNKSISNGNHHNSLNESAVYVEETHQSSPQYTDKWKFQYMTINKQLKHMSNRRLFSDSYFDLTDVRNNIVPNETVVWMRPKDFIERPTLGTNTANYRDVLQGMLDNCAFVAACDSLSKYPFLLKNIFHKDVELYGPNYNGCVKIRLWINDEWVWICIDDRLPTIDGRLCYAHSKQPEHFWVSLIEKAYAKYYGYYENLIGIDSSTVLINLTGGVVLRLNPTIVNDRDIVYNYLNRAFEKRTMIAIAGAELIFNNNEARLIKTKRDQNNFKPQKRNGHAYALVDIVYAHETKKYYVKLRNSKKNMKVFKEISSDAETKILENITEPSSDPNQDNSDILYFSYEDFFEYFETLNIVVILNDYLPGFDVSASGFWSSDSGLRFTNQAYVDEKVIDRYLRSPHFYFNLINKGTKGGIQDLTPINFIVNLVTDLLSENEFIGVVILPIREKPSANKDLKLYFINYTIHRQTLCHINPLCLEVKLLPGKYMIGLITQTESLPKRFCLRLATNTPNAAIMRLQELVKQGDSDDFILAPTNNPNSRPRLIKIILSKCCVCSSLLDESFITSGAKVFCTPCYNLTFRCDICDVELGQVYYTLEQRLCCENCLNNYTKSLNIQELPANKN